MQSGIAQPTLAQISDKKCLITVVLYSNHHDESRNFALIEILRV